jgi:hypothetical protein
MIKSSLVSIPVNGVSRTISRLEIFGCRKLQQFSQGLMENSHYYRCTQEITDKVFLRFFCLFSILFICSHINLFKHKWELTFQHKFHYYFQDRKIKIKKTLTNFAFESHIRPSHVLFFCSPICVKVRFYWFGFGEINMWHENNFQLFSWDMYKRNRMS